jgi:hypothetical protein
MATFETTIHAAQKETRANPARLPAQVGGALQYAVVPYTVAGTEEEGTTDVIKLCILPTGAVPIAGASFVDCEALGTAFVVDIGYASNPDALADGITLTSAGHIPFTSGTQPADAIAPSALAAADTTIYATMATGTSPTAGKKAVFHIAYKLPA